MIYKQQTPEDTYKELTTPDKMETGNSRQYQSSQGYKFLFVWSNAVLLRILIKKFTDFLGEFKSSLKSSKFLYTPLISRLKAQMDDSARSVVANIEEGFKRPTTKEYLEFIGFSQGSLAEVKGDVERCLQDGYLVSQKGRTVMDLGIELGEWGRYLRNPTNATAVLEYPLGESRGVYRNLKEDKSRRTLGEILGEDLAFEHFMELTNKTDWGLRNLVISLEKRQEEEKRKIIWGE